MTHVLIGSLCSHHSALPCRGDSPPPDSGRSQGSWFALQTPQSLTSGKVFICSTLWQRCRIKVAMFYQGTSSPVTSSLSLRCLSTPKSLCPWYKHHFSPARPLCSTPTLNYPSLWAKKDTENCVLFLSFFVVIFFPAMPFLPSFKRNWRILRRDCTMLSGAEQVAVKTFFPSAQSMGWTEKLPQSLDLLISSRWPWTGHSNSAFSSVSYGLGTPASK